MILERENKGMNSQKRSLWNALSLNRRWYFVSSSEDALEDAVAQTHRLKTSRFLALSVLLLDELAALFFIDIWFRVRPGRARFNIRHSLNLNYKLIQTINFSTKKMFPKTSMENGNRGRAD
jgi:hypothetical protein